MKTLIRLKRELRKRKKKKKKGNSLETIFPIEVTFFLSEQLLIGFNSE